MKVLFSQSQLDTLNYTHGNFTSVMRAQRDINQVYADKRLTNLVWAPILRHAQT